MIHPAKYLGWHCKAFCPGASEVSKGEVWWRCYCVTSLASQVCVLCDHGEFPRPVKCEIGATRFKLAHLGHHLWLFQCWNFSHMKIIWWENRQSLL